MKWIKENGEYLSEREYRNLSYSASKNKIPLKDFLNMHGIKSDNSTGELQDPLNNSARLTTWVKLDDFGDLLFLTQWKYKTYFEYSKDNGMSIADYLESIGFKKWKDLYVFNITNWICSKNRTPLSRKDYVSIYNKLDKNIKMDDYLKHLGYLKVGEKKNG